MDAVDELIVPESPQTDSVWVLGRPSLLPVAGDNVMAWADDCRDLTAIPPGHSPQPLGRRRCVH